MAEGREVSNTGTIAVIVAIVAGVLLLLGWIFHIPW
jgi:hypothetical protein